MKKTALITGGARRIGQGIALALASSGYDIIVHYSSSKKQASDLVSHLSSLGVQAHSVKANLLKDGEIKKLIGKAREKLGREISLLVNNASIFEEDSLKAMTLESWNRHIYTNFKAPVFLSQSFAEQVPCAIKDKTGELYARANIVNIIDQKVLNINPKFFTYTLAKMGLWNFTRLAAQELGPDVRVNAIAPGPILKAKHQTEHHFRKQRQSTLLRRGSDIEEITRVLQLILSSPGLTGQMISVDGGEHLTW